VRRFLVPLLLWVTEHRLNPPPFSFLCLAPRRRSDSTQYVLITPQDMSGVRTGPAVRIHKMRDPERCVLLSLCSRRRRRPPKTDAPFSSMPPSRLDNQSRLNFTAE
jgi:hypothetical protein